MTIPRSERVMTVIALTLIGVMSAFDLFVLAKLVRLMAGR